MKDSPLQNRAVYILLLFTLITFILYIGKTFFVPIAASLLLSFLLLPLSNWFVSKKLPESVSILLSIFCMILTLGGVILFVSTQFMAFSEELPLLSHRLNEKFTLLQQYINEKFLISEKRQLDWLNEQITTFMSKGGKLIGDLFSATGNFLAIAVLIPIYIFFFIYYRRKFSAFIKMIAPSKNHEQINTIISKTSKVSQRYITGLLIDIAILSVLNSIGFMLLGLKHAFLLGTIAGMLNIIPYIGVTIGSILPVLLALITHDSLWIAVGAFGVCVAVQILDNNFLTPWIVGSAVAINPLATMIALIMGGMLWGLPGMMLFIPLLGMLKVIFDNIDTLKPLGFLISDDNIHAKKEASSDNNPNITESPSS